MNKVRNLLSIDAIHDKGIKGKGVTIAILDTGAWEHRDFSDRIVGFKDFVNGRTALYDDNGHGTHIAGICGGSGYMSGGKYKGMCPEINILPIKVLDSKGHGVEENVISAARWLIDNRINYGVDIVNISFGTACEKKGGLSTPLVKAVEEMWEVGMIVVAAAGNNGPEEGSVTSPGVSRKIITVGALDDRRKVSINGRMRSDYSGRGRSGDVYVKPDLIAPATMITSCAKKGARTYYCIKSGTSMAVPVVCGCIGLLLGEDRSHGNNEIKIKLKNSCDSRNLPEIRQGRGLVNPRRFLKTL